MARKPTDYVQVKVRMRESLRRKLEKAAEKTKVSANAEAIQRIEYTFDEEERWEAHHKEMEERKDELEEQQRQWYEEQAKREAEIESALRDSRLLTTMLGNRDNTELLRVMVYYIHQHPEWTTSDEKRKALADAIHSFLIGANDVFQGQSK
jgi:hypothetical protein